MAASIPAKSDMQERVFAFLTDRATHPEVKRIDTHGASAFLEGKRALKIKRAVRFPFLDYSTLEKRKVACDEEIAINRAFAPQIYRHACDRWRRRAGRVCHRDDPLRRAADLRSSGASRSPRPRAHRRRRGSNRGLPR